MLSRPYEMPWRRAHEASASAAWILASTYFGACGVLGFLPALTAAPVALLCLLMACLRGAQAVRVLRVRASLSGRRMEVMPIAEFNRCCERPDDEVLLGFGFDWTPVHSQRLYELSKLDVRDLMLPAWLLPWIGRSAEPQPDNEIGLPYIHGVEQVETPLRRPLQNFEGGTLVIGTTQAGKGVALAALITQAVRRGDTVVIIDPKNSHRLQAIVERACRDWREPDTFLSFHPAFPERGVRLDFAFNWQKPTELASRVQSILPPDTAGAFSAFAWDAVNVVVQGLVELEERPSLLKLSKYIEGGIDHVLERCLERLFARILGAGWRETEQLKRTIADAGKGPSRTSPSASKELLGYVAFYETRIPQRQRDKVVDAQIRVFRHNREHYQKITASLLPILSMLTTGDLGRTLSPDPFDVNDVRPIMNLEKIEHANHVLYMCLDALPDPSVATAIGALALADLAARAGMRYNLGGHRRISLFVDEASNVINRPLLEIMNKGAEGGIYTTCAMQTIADLAWRLGSEAAARVALGNLNNLIALRSKDRPTQDFIVETFGRTAIHSVRVGLNAGSDTHLGDFSAGHSTQLAESFEDLVPADVLGKLPNCQYFASVSGGRIRKGRLPILDPGQAPSATGTA